MSNVLNIQIQDEDLDLFPGEIFTLTLQATDFINLTGTKTDFSKTIEVPTTANNNRIFGLTDQIFSQSVAPYRKLKAKVIQNGTEIVPAGTCIVESTEETIYKITIYGGALSVSDILKEVSLQNLNLSNLDFDYTLANAVILAGNDSGVVWGVMSYPERASPIFINSLDIRFSYFGVYLRTLLDTVADQVGIEILGLDDLFTPPINDLVIPLSQEPRVDSLFQRRRGFIAESSALITYDTFTPQIIAFDTVLAGNGAGEYIDTGVNTGVYESNETFRFTVTYNISGEKFLDNGDAIFTIRSAVAGANTAGDWYAEEIITQSGVFSFELTASGIYPGAVAQFFLSLSFDVLDSVDVNANSTVNFACTDIAVNLEDSGSNRGSLISVARSLPDVSMWDIIVSVRQIYGGIQQTNTISGELSVIRFEDIDNQPQVDWSDKLDVSEPARINFRAENLFQVNSFRYAEDEETLADADASFIISDRNLAAAGTIAQLPYAASPVDNFEGFLTCKISLFNLDEIAEGTLTVPANTGGFVRLILDEKEADISINDTLLVEAIATSIIEIDQEEGVKTDVTVFSPETLTQGSGISFRISRPVAQSRIIRLVQKRISTSSINYTSGASIQVVSNPRVMSFVDAPEGISLVWDTFLTNNYPLFIGRVQQEKILTARFNLTEADIRELDFLRPHYIEKFGNFFYLNRIDKYRIDQSTQCTLVSLHFGFGGNEVASWSSTTYDEFNSLRNNILRAFEEATGTAFGESNDFEVQENEIYRISYDLNFFAVFGMNFNAQRTGQQDFVADGDVIFQNVLSGNDFGNYNNLTGAYTFDAPYTGIFSTSGIITDDPGAGGGSTISLESDLQGTLDSLVIANNTTVAFDLEFQGSFAINEVVTVMVTTSMASVASGANFSFAYLSGSVPALISDVSAQIFIGATPASTSRVLTQGPNNDELIVNTSGQAKLRLTTDDAVDYSITVRLEKQSAGN